MACDLSSRKRGEGCSFKISTVMGAPRQARTEFSKAPRICEDNEPALSEECPLPGFRPSDGVALSNRDTTAKLQLNSSQIMVSKDWISMDQPCEQRSWIVVWGKKTGDTDLSYAPLVGITEGRSFDDNSGFTVVFDFQGNVRFGRSPLQLPWVMFRDEFSERFPEAITEQSATAKPSPGYFKVTFNIKTRVLNVVFGKPSSASASSRGVTVHIDKLVKGAQFKQARLCVLLQNSNNESERKVTIGRPT